MRIVIENVYRATVKYKRKLNQKELGYLAGDIENFLLSKKSIVCKTFVDVR